MSQKTILVVDDAPENIDVLVGLLKQNYKVKAAINGDRAIKIAQSSNPPDLMLLDIVMPEQDGIEVYKILKSNPATAKIPVVFCSDKVTSEKSDRGIDLGGNAYIKKPIDPECLYSILEILLPA